MTRRRLRPLLAGLFIISPLALSDEWGTWNDLPDNLLESEQDVRTLDELSNQLDQLIQANRDVDDSLRRQLLRHWLDQINSGANKNISLDRLLEMSADWENDELAEWYDDLEDYLEEQTTPIDQNGDLIGDPLDDEDNSDDDGSIDDGDTEPGEGDPVDGETAPPTDDGNDDGSGDDSETG
ncbi:hypothetical protein [Saccharospirillum salsuginis]|uniref:Uncharacterized protein n=1 Tax=Saccharospirillum salsuginis TaxID=418750 RepID=A0A918N4G1_9GAMM|nr:hypothetical protein [Saccharospirillum salsuginis]GGX37964.1 hypothetical protein GCM10007392_00070 [Saccharospirillum salsuginis]